MFCLLHSVLVLNIPPSSYCQCRADMKVWTLELNSQEKKLEMGMFSGKRKKWQGGRACVSKYFWSLCYRGRAKGMEKTPAIRSYRGPSLVQHGRNVLTVKGVSLSWERECLQRQLRGCSPRGRKLTREPLTSLPTRTLWISSFPIPTRWAQPAFQMTD